MIWLLVPVAFAAGFILAWMWTSNAAAQVLGSAMKVQGVAAQTLDSATAQATLSARIDTLSTSIGDLVSSQDKLTVQVDKSDVTVGNMFKALFDRGLFSTVPTAAQQARKAREGGEL